MYTFFGVTTVFFNFKSSSFPLFHPIYMPAVPNAVGRDEWFGDYFVTTT